LYPDETFCYSLYSPLSLVSTVPVPYWIFKISVADPHHFDPDPDPACHFVADPNPDCHFGADPDPAFHFGADPDPDPTFPIDADPDPAYHVDAHPDPDPTFQFDADQSGSGSTTSICPTFLYINIFFLFLIRKLFCSVSLSLFGCSIFLFRIFVGTRYQGVLFHCIQMQTHPSQLLKSLVKHLMLLAAI
jgi:hypothetical protein